MKLRRLFGAILGTFFLVVPAGATGGTSTVNNQCPCDAPQGHIQATGPNKNFTFACDAKVQPFIDRAGMVIVVTDRNGKESVRGVCGMKTAKWHFEDFDQTLCQSNQWQMNDYLSQMDHNDALICGMNGPKIIKAPGNGLDCARDLIQKERIPLYQGESMRLYYRHAWSPAGDGSGQGGTNVYGASCNTQCLDQKDNNQNGVADVVDMRAGKYINGNVDLNYPQFSGWYRNHTADLPWVKTNGWVEQQNFNLYAPNKGLFTGADRLGLELDVARHEYGFLLNNADGRNELGVKVRAAARPNTPCGDRVQSFEVLAQKQNGTRTKLGQVNMRPVSSIPQFETYTFPFTSGETGYSRVILKERSSCRTGNFAGGSLISQVWIAKRDPVCQNPEDPENGTPPKECSDHQDNDGDGKVDWPNDPGCTGPNDDDETDPQNNPECSDNQDNDGDGKVDWPNDPGCTGPNDDDETDPQNNPECSDGIDNDGDGRVDYVPLANPNDLNDPANQDYFNNHDPGCMGPNDDDESDDGTCLDGQDNENDGWIDLSDPHDCGPKTQFPDSKGSETGNGVLAPRASCKEVFNDWVYYHVGFANFTGQTHTIPVGTNNGNRAHYFSKNGAAYTPYNVQSYFPKGVHDGFISVVLPIAEANASINWYLGVNGNIDGITMDSSMPNCPETDVVFVSCQGGQATFGIDNHKPFNPLYRYHRENQFSPNPKYRQQGVRFSDGQTVTVPASNGHTWHLAGNSATVNNCQ